jgi:hypothetical protein
VNNDGLQAPPVSFGLPRAATVPMGQPMTHRRNERNNGLQGDMTDIGTGIDVAEGHPNSRTLPLMSQAPNGMIWARPHPTNH